MTTKAPSNLTWWMKPDGLSLRLEGDLPLATGAAFCAAIDRVAGTLPDLPPEEGQPVRDPRFTIEQRRADALALMASALIANDQEPDLATVVLSTSLDAPAVETDAVGGILKGLGLSLGGALAAETAERIACDCRLSVARLDGLGDTVGIGRVSRTIPRWLRRQLMTRDGHQCQFPGCDAVRFLHGHHIWHWALGGPTNLDNLIALCHAHHTLVHEFGWGVKRDRFGEVTWFRPSGQIFSPGPAPPEAPSEGSAQPKTTEVPRLIEARGFSRLFALSDCL
jgi:hypothetical protein